APGLLLDGLLDLVDEGTRRDRLGLRLRQRQRVLEPAQALAGRAAGAVEPLERVVARERTGQLGQAHEKAPFTVSGRRSAGPGEEKQAAGQRRGGRGAAESGGIARLAGLTAAGRPGLGGAVPAGSAGRGSLGGD